MYFTKNYNLLYTKHVLNDTIFYLKKENDLMCIYI